MFSRRFPRDDIPGLGAVILLAILACSAGPGDAAGVAWRHLSSVTGDLPVPGPSTQQTATIVGDFDGDGVNDFALGFRQVAPAVVWYRRVAEGWTRHVLDPEFLTIEAGGAVHDIDRDGDLDLVFGTDAQGNRLFWWENPLPDKNSGDVWRRHIIKDDGANQHHDQVFGAFLGTGDVQLAFWNQRARTVFLAPIPEAPRERVSWPFSAIYEAQPTERGSPYLEGLDAADIDGDGRADLLAGNGWLKHLGNGRFAFTAIADYGGRIRAGDFHEGGRPEVVIAPGDGNGPLMLYECSGNPADPAAWTGRDLLGREVVHGHTLEVGDVDRDGHLDILCAEMAEWTGPRDEIDHPGATAWILYGDGQGGFGVTELSKGRGFHDARLADLDGDGDLDVLDKPYTWDAPRVDVWINEGPRTPGTETRR